MCYLREAVVSVLFRGSNGVLFRGSSVSVLYRGSNGECVI